MDLRPKEIVEHYVKEAKEMLGEMPKQGHLIHARWMEAANLYDTAIHVSLFFDLAHKRLQDAQEKCIQEAEKYKEAAEAFEAKVQYRRDNRDRLSMEREENRRAARLEKNQELMELWMSGEKVDTYSLGDFPVRLRVVIDKTEQEDEEAVIETSHGAAIPYDEGQRTFEFIMKMRGRAWRRNGETFQVGDYQLDMITENGDISAGCHRIAWETILEFAKSEGWIQSTERKTGEHLFVEAGGHPVCADCGADEDDAFVGGEPCTHINHNEKEMETVA